MGLLGVFTKLFHHKKHPKSSEECDQPISDEPVDADTTTDAEKNNPTLIVENEPQRPFGARNHVEEGQEYQWTRRGGPEQKPGAQPTKPKKAGAGSVMDKAADGKTGAQQQDGVGAASRSAGEARAAEGTVIQAPVFLTPTIHAVHLLNAFAVLYALFLVLLLRWANPSAWELFSSMALGLSLGAGYAWLFHANKRRKQRLNALLNVTPGRKGLLKELGQVPSWVSFQDKEKVEWLNRTLRELWPYYDKAISAMVRETVEPLMEQYKPPGLIKKIYFKRLTFGDSPIRIDNVWVEDEGEEHVLLEVALRWAGDANIALAVELPAGGEATRMVPKVTDLQVGATARVLLSPLVPIIPGFGAVVFSLRKPPLLKFNLDFGKAFGGSISARLVRLWLDPFLRHTLADMLVWPNRIVSPILPEEQTGPLNHLYLRHMGLLVVTAVEARDIKKMDMLGKSDPMLEIYTQATHIQKTETCKNTLNPKWEEDLYMLVQEPKTQFMRLEMYDVDFLNVKELLQVNLVKGLKESLHHKTFMARQAIPMRQFADHPGQEIDDWYELGKGHYSDDLGPGKGQGKVRLKVTYYPWDILYSEPRPATLGAILITVKKAWNLPAADSGGTSDPYAVVSLDEKMRKTAVQPRTLEPVWNQAFEFHHVPSSEVIEVTVWDKDELTGDAALGTVDIKIDDLLTKAHGERVYSFHLHEVKEDRRTKEKPDASISLQLQWVPFNFFKKAPSASPSPSGPSPAPSPSAGPPPAKPATPTAAPRPSPGAHAPPPAVPSPDPAAPAAPSHPTPVPERCEPALVPMPIVAGHAPASRPAPQPVTGPLGGAYAGGLSGPPAGLKEDFLHAGDYDGPSLHPGEHNL